MGFQTLKLLDISPSQTSKSLNKQSSSEESKKNITIAPNQIMMAQVHIHEKCELPSSWLMKICFRFCIYDTKAIFRGNCSKDSWSSQWELAHCSRDQVTKGKEWSAQVCVCNLTLQHGELGWLWTSFRWHIMNIYRSDPGPSARSLSRSSFNSDTDSFKVGRRVLRNGSE